MVDEASLMEYYFKNGYPECMSIWEISHLWHDINPQHNDILDMQVQKTIMVFSQWIMRGAINICAEGGYTYDVKNGIYGERDFFKIHYPAYANKEYKDIPTEAHKAWDERVEYEGRKSTQYYDFAGDIVNIYKTQDFNKEVLKKVFLDAGEIEWFCGKSNIPLPKFWFPESEQVKSTKDMNVNIKNSTKLFKVLLKVKSNNSYFCKDETRDRMQVVIDLAKEYSISQNDGKAIYQILNPNKKGGNKKITPKG